MFFGRTCHRDTAKGSRAPRKATNNNSQEQVQNDRCEGAVSTSSHRALRADADSIGFVFIVALVLAIVNSKNGKCNELKYCCGIEKGR